MMIPEPNCLKSPRKAAVLDSVWSAARDLAPAVSVGEVLCDGDHSTIGFSAAEGQCRPQKSRVHTLNFRKGNYVKMRQVVKKKKKKRQTQHQSEETHQKQEMATG